MLVSFFAFARPAVSENPTEGRIRKSRAGFTLIELLVVISIIGILMGLLLPAVQAVRGAARTASCSNNLHQIGVAMHNHHNFKKKFPVGGYQPRHLHGKDGLQLAWSAYLLPFMEQESLHGQIDFTKAFDSEENKIAAATIIPTYLCPEVSRDSNLVKGRGACDYGGMFGERMTCSNRPPRGTMIYDKPIRIRGITDGTSYTLMISEDSNWSDGQWINGLNIFDQRYPINYVPDDPRKIENEIRSEHSGGANGLFCDGSVRFLDEDMEDKVLAAICTRDGEEIFDGF